MNDIFDKIASSRPVNKSTAVANSGGFSYVRPTSSRDTFAAPPKMKPIPKNGINLIGIKRGKLVVIGLADAKKAKNRPASWVVKCICGNYETRTAKAICNADNVGDACQDCHRTLLLKKLDWERQFGKEKAIKMKETELRATERILKK